MMRVLFIVISTGLIACGATQSEAFPKDQSVEQRNSKKERRQVTQQTKAQDTKQACEEAKIAYLKAKKGKNEVAAQAANQKIKQQCLVSR